MGLSLIRGNNVERFQRSVNQWRSIMPSEYATPEAEFQRSLEEVDEVKKAIENNDGSLEAQKEIGSEAVDVIIRMLGVASSVGVDVESVLFNKIEHTTRIKYPNDIIQFRMNQGQEWHEAMASEKVLFEQGTSWGQRWQKRLLTTHRLIHSNHKSL